MENVKICKLLTAASYTALKCMLLTYRTVKHPVCLPAHPVSPFPPNTRSPSFTGLTPYFPPPEKNSPAHLHLISLSRVSFSPTMHPLCNFSVMNCIDRFVPPGSVTFDCRHSLPKRLMHKTGHSISHLFLTCPLSGPHCRQTLSALPAATGQHPTSTSSQLQPTCGHAAPLMCVQLPFAFLGSALRPRPQPARPRVARQRVQTLPPLP